MCEGLVMSCAFFRLAIDEYHLASHRRVAVRRTIQLLRGKGLSFYILILVF